MSKSLSERLRQSYAERGGYGYLSRKRQWTVEEVRDLCDFLQEIEDVGPLLDVRGGSPYSTPLYELVMAFQNEWDEPSVEYVREVGLPALLRLTELALAEPEPPPHPLTMAAKMFVMYCFEPSVETVVELVRRFPGEYMFSPAFNMLADERHPLGPAVVERLSDPLPQEFAAILTLDLANALSRQKRLDHHPYNTPAGIERLEGWLRSADEEEFSYAVSAAASLPFLEMAARGRLATLAFDHVEPTVQLEAAWASAFGGNEAGLKVLARMATNPAYSLRARAYLEELERQDVIPASALDPNFEAMAQMCDWLAHPQEFGKPPTTIELYDARTLDWPPTNDSRPVWLFRYRYEAHGENGEDDVGIGMVGSVTFALFGEATGDLSPEDVYGLHCCWELECNGDSRAPEKRTAAAGRALLGI